MEDALDLCDLAAAAVAMFEPQAFDDDLLRNSTLRIQQHIDRMKVLQASLLAEVERRRAFAGTGARNAADWLSSRSKSSRSDAKRRARLGKALSASPDLKDAVDKGEVSADSAEAVADAVTNRPANATDDDLRDLIDAVKGSDPQEAKEAADLWSQLLSNETEEEAHERRYRARSLKSGQPTDGMASTTFTLPLLDHRTVLDAISHAAGKPYEGDSRTTEQRMADGLIAICDAYARGQVTGGREKPTVLITIPLDGVTGASNAPGVTTHGERIPAHVVRQLAEHATLQRVLLVGSQVIDLGREVRFATEQQFRALAARDGGCRWPGCSMPADWCDADHFVSWDDHGDSDLDNLWLLCRHHHSERHRPGIRLTGDVINPVIHLIDGTVIDASLTRRRPTQAAA